MKVKIKRFNKDLPMPEYKTSGAIGFDMYVRFDETVRPHEVKAFPSNLGIQIPKGHFLLVNSRSSTASKFGLLVIPGTIDPDFCGDEDEMKISVYNITGKVVEIAAGTRIAQGIFIKTSRGEFKEVKKLGSKSRGGFGTTGY